MTRAAVSVGLGLAGIALVVAGGLYLGSRWRAGRPTAEERIEDLPGVSGTLLLSTYGSTGSGGEGVADREPLVHSSLFVNGRGYSGMEDNDLRGFLDGRFKNGWSQVGQYHVRVGRREDGPKYGEHELMRVLYRWAGLELPAGALVESARIRLAIERGPNLNLRLYLYSVNKDWDPGSGGTLGDSTSPPVEGEVWWNDAAYGRLPWGLPGAGFASDEHADADTPRTPLAEAVYEPEQRELTFSSPRLTGYVAERLERGLPLLFLLKLSDHLEDLPGTRIHLFSASSGDSRTVARRPRLQLDWSSTAELGRRRIQEIVLEHGRELLLPRMKAAGSSFVAATFVSRSGYEEPTIEVRGGRGGQISGWLPLELPRGLDEWDWLQVRLRAVANPVGLGSMFRARLSDTWVTSAKPADQRVRWRFVSPRGRRYEVVANYLKDYEWEVEFAPDELGRWEYRWSQEFTGTERRGPRGRFDVVADDLESVMEALRALQRAIAKASVNDRDARLRRFEWRFVRLERAALSMQTPESYRSLEWVELRRLLDEVREALWGSKVPAEIPLRPYPREWWERDGRPAPAR